MQSPEAQRVAIKSLCRYGTPGTNARGIIWKAVYSQLASLNTLGGKGVLFEGSTAVNVLASNVGIPSNPSGIPIVASTCSENPDTLVNRLVPSIAVAASSAASHLCVPESSFDEMRRLIRCTALPLAGGDCVSVHIYVVNDRNGEELAGRLTIFTAVDQFQSHLDHVNATGITFVASATSASMENVMIPDPLITLDEQLRFLNVFSATPNACAGDIEVLKSSVIQLVFAVIAANDKQRAVKAWNRAKAVIPVIEYAGTMLGAFFTGERLTAPNETAPSRSQVDPPVHKSADSVTATDGKKAGGVALQKNAFVEWEEALHAREKRVSERETQLSDAKQKCIDEARRKASERIADEIRKREDAEIRETALRETCVAMESANADLRQSLEDAERRAAEAAVHAKEMEDNSQQKASELITIKETVHSLRRQLSSSVTEAGTLQRRLEEKRHQIQELKDEVALNEAQLKNSTMSAVDDSLSEHGGGGEKESGTGRRKHNNKKKRRGRRVTSKAAGVEEASKESHAGRAKLDLVDTCQSVMDEIHHMTSDIEADTGICVAGVNQRCSINEVRMQIQRYMNQCFLDVVEEHTSQARMFAEDDVDGFGDSSVYTFYRLLAKSVASVETFRGREEAGSAGQSNEMMSTASALSMAFKTCLASAFQAVGSEFVEGETQISDSARDRVCDHVFTVPFSPDGDAMFNKSYRSDSVFPPEAWSVLDLRPFTLKVQSRTNGQKCDDETEEEIDTRFKLPLVAAQHAYAAASMYAFAQDKVHTQILLKVSMHLQKLAKHADSLVRLVTIIADETSSAEASEERST